MAAKPATPISARIPLATLLIVGCVTLVCSGLSLWLYQHFVIAGSHTRLAQLTEEIAQRRHHSVANYVRSTQERLNAFVSRASVSAQLQAPAPAAAQHLLQELRAAFPDLLSASLVTPERTDLLSDAAFAPSFIELDMLNRASRNETVKPEIIQHAGTDMLLFIAPVAAPAAPQPTAAPVTGNLLLRLPLASLSQSLNNSDTALGATRVLQSVGQGQPIVVTSAGQGLAEPLSKLYVDNSNWYITFSPAPALVQQTRVNPIPLLGACLLLSLLLIGASYQVCRRYVDIAVPAPPLHPPQVHASRSDHTGEAVAAPASDDILDLDLDAADEELLGLNSAARRPGAPAPAPAALAPATMQVDEEPVVCPAQIFRAYDIRGIVDTEITADLAYQIGQAIGSETLFQGQPSLFVARDGRTHAPVIARQLIDGILHSGCNVVDLGAVPTPLLYFATCTQSTGSSGVMVTASHNPADYNGFKVVINGTTLAGDAIQNLRRRIVSRDLHSGHGHYSSLDIVPAYIDRIFSDVALAGPIKLVIDAGNGITGELAPRLFEELGCEVIPLYCEVDGSFPNHEADPSQAANLADLISKVRETGADLGLAFDGDGDRLGVVSNSGEIIWPDRLLMLFAKDIVTGHPGCDVLFDVKCSRELNRLVSSYGGRPIMWKTGHSNMKAKMVETGALIGGELSGHIFIKDRWYGFDDGMYAGARLLEIMTLRDQALDDIFSSFPVLPATPEIKIAIDESDKFSLIESLIQTGQFENGNLTTLDGLRVDFAKGWGLVRASNTSPALTLRFEGESQDIIDELQRLFKRELLKLNPNLAIPF